MRLEFTRKVKAAAIARANGSCQECGLPFKGRPEVDHILPAALGGEPTLINARAICRPCHATKTTADVRGIRKADRQRDRANGALRARMPFPKPIKVPKPMKKPPLAPKVLFVPIAALAKEKGDE